MEARIFVNYDSIVGEKLAKISKPTFIQNNTLFIGVENHIWLHQLHFLKPDLIDKINSKLPRPLVKDIRFKVCDIKKDSKTEKNIDRKKDPPVSVPQKTLDFIHDISQLIDDGELRQTFVELMIKDAKFKLKRGKAVVYPHRR